MADIGKSHTSWASTSAIDDPIFQALMAKESQSPSITFRALKYKPQDYQIIVNLFQGEGGHAILSEVINGATILTEN